VTSINTAYLGYLRRKKRKKNKNTLGGIVSMIWHVEWVFVKHLLL
jgi:hypothetical protein